MIKRELAELATYTVDEECEMLPLACLRKVYLEKTSEIIYVNKGKKLYGIVCMGEVLYGNKQNALVKINKHFQSLNGFNLIKAHEFFERWADINKIPVVNEEGELIGDYSRWDMLYVEQNQTQLMQEKTVKRVLGNYEKIYVIQPSEKKHPDYLRLLKYLTQFEIDYSVLKKEELYENLLGDNVICIFLDEDERRGMQCLCGIEPSTYDSRGNNRFRFDIPVNAWSKIRITTYENLLRQIEEENSLERLGLELPKNLAYERIDEKATVLLAALQRKGCKSFFLQLIEGKTEYGKLFLQKVRERVNNIPINQEEWMWSEGEEKEAFYGELYQSKDYREGIAQKEIHSGIFSIAYKRNIKGKYFNAKEGKRVTCFQPDRYIGTIYLMGMCGIMGMFVEDQHTIASYLQKKLAEKGYLYRVENYGSNLRNDADIDSRLEEIREFSERDIVIYMSTQGEGSGIGGTSFEQIFERHQVPVQWVTDGYGHCNYLANKVVSEDIFEMIESHLSKIQSYEYKGKTQKEVINIRDIMKTYVRKEYLNRYFQCFEGEKYETVGAMVLNANPFHKGHRYLIEEAKKQVDFLILFLREEKMLFSFEERFEMMKRSICDIKNVMMVPSGKFFLPRNQFWVNYSREVFALNTEYDVNVFADYIAKPLHITHRFVKKGATTGAEEIYNDIMRDILNAKGIQVVEVPEMKIEGESVNTARIHKYLKKEEYDRVLPLLPEMTRSYLWQQLNVANS